MAALPIAVVLPPAADHYQRVLSVLVRPDLRDGLGRGWVALGLDPSTRMSPWSQGLVLHILRKRKVVATIRPATATFLSQLRRRKGRSARARMVAYYLSSRPDSSRFIFLRTKERCEVTSIAQ